MNGIPYTSFKEYLKAKDLLNASQEVIDRARIEWKRIYGKAYMKMYDKKQVNTVFIKTEYQELKNKASRFKLKVPEYIRHLVKQDSCGVSTPPNFLIDIEVGILKAIDSITKEFGASIETRAKVVSVITKLEEILTLLA